MLILATNRKQDLDPAVLDRMDHKLRVDPPKLAERKKIIQMYLPKFMNGKELNELFNDKVISNMAYKTDGFTGRKLYKMLNCMASKRAMTADNQLTGQMVNKTVEDFIASA